MARTLGVIVHPVAAERIDPAAVDVLERNDVLFVNTTHTVKTGGEVVHIVLDMLPRLAPGIYVHCHDISCLTTILGNGL